METRKLGTQTRESIGKGVARKLRAEGKIPAVLYGHGEESLSITVKEQDLRKLLASKWETTIVDLSISGRVKKECNAIIKDVQQHPASGRILHVDFQSVRRGEKIRLDVPVTLTGDPKGVKEMGGILEHGLREAAIRCMPRHIPESVELDVASLGIHDALHIKDIVASYPDLEFLDDPESTLAIVVPPKVEVEPVAAEEEVAEEEPEVIAKGKEEGEQPEEEK
ncbi:MAG: 50S ribosomal protein L25 [Candidatus Krumholzibacteria bacterium]|nr:50S ribosomal protein L25 [Candidatus Krumholzibacteria bacterium]